jgi:tetratricopeptide (TPR) repeat protein
MGTARQWLVSGCMDNYVKTLERGWFEKDVKCGSELALYYKRNGNYTEAEKIWRQLNSNRSDYYSAVELAKYYEHKLKDYEKALQTVNKVSASPAGILRRKDVEYRKNRLIRKMNAEKLRFNKK